MQVQARQKNPKGSLLPMSATNKGHIKTGHKTMIYVLSLMRLLSARPSVSPPMGPSIHPSIVRSSIRTQPSLPFFFLGSSSFPLIIFFIASLLVLLLLLLLLLRPLRFYRFRRIAPSGWRWSIRRLEKVACRYHRTIIIHCEISRMIGAWRRATRRKRKLHRAQHFPVTCHCIIKLFSRVLLSVPYIAAIN